MLLTYIYVLIGSIISCGMLIRAFQREVANIEHRPFGIRLSELSDWKNIRTLRIMDAAHSFGVEFVRRFANIALETTTICCTRFPIIIFEEHAQLSKLYPSLCSRTPLISIGPAAQTLDEKSLIGLVACELARYSRQFTFSELLFYFISWRSEYAEWAIDTLAARYVGWEPVIAHLESLRSAANKERDTEMSEKLGLRLSLLRIAGRR